jgi:hypothetical protein
MPIRTKVAAVAQQKAEEKMNENQEIPCSVPIHGPRVNFFLEKLK